MSRLEQRLISNSWAA